jgi:hypothetical protein
MRGVVISTRRALIAPQFKSFRHIVPYEISEAEPAGFPTR